MAIFRPRGLEFVLLKCKSTRTGKFSLAIRSLLLMLGKNSMTSQFELTAELRAQDQLGKRPSRKMRAEEQVPAIIYGAGKKPTPVLLNHHRVNKVLENKAIYSHILTVHLNQGESEKVILKAMQRHPFKPKILHIDFQRINASEKLTIHVPLKFINEASAKGVKQSGGVIHHHRIDVEITCLPADLPELIEVDVIDMAIGDTLHLSHLKLPNGVSIHGLVSESANDLPVVSITTPKAQVEESSTAPGTEAGTTPAAGDAVPDSK